MTKLKSVNKKNKIQLKTFLLLKYQKLFKKIGQQKKSCFVGAFTWNRPVPVMKSFLTCQDYLCLNIAFMQDFLVCKAFFDAY